MRQGPSYRLPRFDYSTADIRFNPIPSITPVTDNDYEFNTGYTGRRAYHKGKHD